VSVFPTNMLAEPPAVVENKTQGILAMKTIEDIDGFILKLELPYSELDHGMWLIQDQQETISIVVSLSGPVLVMRIKIFELKDSQDKTGLFRLLLELNASELLYGAYGLENNEVVLVESLSLEHLDFSLFQEAVEALIMTVATQYGMISRALGSKASQAEAR
jgi:hypothetical protein